MIRVNPDRELEEYRRINKMIKKEVNKDKIIIDKLSEHTDSLILENAKLKARETELVKGPDMDAVGLGAEPSYRALWDRNKVLEAQIANIKEGLSRLTTRVMARPDTVISAVNVDGIGMIGLFNHDIEVATGKDFVGLIDHLLTQERCYE